VAVARARPTWPVVAAIRRVTSSDKEPDCIEAASRTAPRFGFLQSRTVPLRRRRSAVRPELRRSFEAFRLSAALIEEARSTLLLGVPSGRASRLPLAEALAGFEGLLDEAAGVMPSWRISEVETEWQSCEEALGESAGRAERLRLGSAPDGYEQLAPVLEGLIEPLAAFERAADRYRALGL